MRAPTPARIIAAGLRPAHAGPLLGVAGQEITNRVVPLDAVLAGLADELASRLDETPSVAGRFNRDFRHFTGATPTEFLALRDPSTQAKR
ncbi:MAG: hypothetical protein M0C28_24540 [Candidatus Moduliflexus flocculans]|nr:hypothetical protein [Candidatus Moduliflexus flocculans]